LAFPTYRQQGILIARGWPLLDMMCQCYSKRAGPAQRPPAAGALFSAARGVVLPRSPAILGNQFSAGRRVGDGLGLTRATGASRSAWIGEGLDRRNRIFTTR